MISHVSKGCDFIVAQVRPDADKAAPYAELTPGDPRRLCDLEEVPGPFAQFGVRGRRRMALPLHNQEIGVGEGETRR